MKTLRVNFVDFWPNLIKTDNLYYNILSTKYRVVIDEVSPEVLFFSADYDRKGDRFRFKNCLRVFHTGESDSPNWNEADIAFTQRHIDDPRHFRMPGWATYLNWYNRPYDDNRDQANLMSIEKLLTKPREVEKPRFCSFLAMQPKGRRVQFVPKLSQYKQVDCAGPLYHNTDYDIVDSKGNKARGDQRYKTDWIKLYKFDVAMENASIPGYATERIIHALYENTIPIYWGSETIEQDFNPECFINWHRHGSDEATIEDIKELDSDMKKYVKMLREPFWIDNKIPDSVRPEAVLAFLDRYIN